MAHQVKLAMDGLLINWLKTVGEAVAGDDVIAEFEADKATVEVEAGASGTLLELRAEPGDEIDEGAVIAVIGAADAPPSPAASDEPEPPAAAAAVPSAADGRLKASPLARRIAADKGIDLRQVQGSGPAGRIVKADVENWTADQAETPSPAAAAAAPTWVEVEGHPVGAAAGFADGFGDAAGGGHPVYHRRFPAQIDEQPVAVRVPEGAFGEGEVGCQPQGFLAGFNDAGQVFGHNQPPCLGAAPFRFGLGFRFRCRGGFPPVGAVENAALGFGQIPYFGDVRHIDFVIGHCGQRGKFPLLLRGQVRKFLPHTISSRDCLPGER